MEATARTDAVARVGRDRMRMRGSGMFCRGEVEGDAIAEITVRGICGEPE